MVASSTTTSSSGPWQPREAAKLPTAAIHGSPKDVRTWHHNGGYRCPEQISVRGSTAGRPEVWFERRQNSIWQSGNGPKRMEACTELVGTALAAESRIKHLNRNPLILTESFAVTALIMSAASQQHSVGSDGELYRHDGVRITHDPFSDGMAEKYGAPGSTDREGFDPYADSVGAGIYSGTVVRDEHGAITVGQQYQNHNPNPGPVYSGGGYTPISMAIA
eukprot:gene22924-7091_t